MAAPALGVHESISSADYHAGPGLSSSGVKTAHGSLLKYKHEFIDGNRQEDTAALLLGRVVHAIVLECLQDGGEEFFVVDASTRNTKAYKQAREDNPGKSGLLQSELDEARRIAAAVRANNQASRLLLGAANEHSVYWQEGDTLCKCRPDAWRHDLRTVVDLKTAQDASPDGFRRAVMRFGYHISAAWYRRGIEAETSEPLSAWAWIAVETKPPYACQVYTAEPALLTYGDSICMETLDKIRGAERSGNWPGYSDNILPIGLPAWVRD